MKKSKLKLITKILAILTICLVSFVGIYMQKANKMENIVKGYELTKDLKGYREVTLELSDATEVLDSNGRVVGDTSKYDDEQIETNKYKVSDTPINKEENLTKENYETTKNILIKRLKMMNVDDYNISLDKSNGKIYLQIPEDSETDRIISNISEKGGLQIKDSTDGTVYITTEHLKSAKSLYNTTEQGTTVYLQIQLNKEGTSILKDLSTNEYATKPEENTTSNETANEASNETSANETKNETTEKESDKNETSEENAEETEQKDEEQKKVILAISGNDMITTSFDEPTENGTIDLSMGQVSKDEDTIQDTLRSTSTIVTILETGELPLTYTVTNNQYVKTDISNDMIRNTIIVTGTILAVLLVFMIIKHKIRGLLGVIAYIGFVALYLLLIRYTNVPISLSGAIAIGVILLINYILNMQLLSIDSENSKIYKKEYLKFIAKMIPIAIVSIIFIFSKWLALINFGMLAFWGILLMIIYNILVTKSIVN